MSVPTVPLAATEVDWELFERNFSNWESQNAQEYLGLLAMPLTTIKEVMAFMKHFPGYDDKERNGEPSEICCRGIAAWIEVSKKLIEEEAIDPASAARVLDQVHKSVYLLAFEKWLSFAKTSYTLLADRYRMIDWHTAYESETKKNLAQAICDLRLKDSQIDEAEVLLKNHSECLHRLAEKRFGLVEEKAKKMSKPDLVGLWQKVRGKGDCGLRLFALILEKTETLAELQELKTALVDDQPESVKSRRESVEFKELELVNSAIDNKKLPFVEKTEDVFVLRKMMDPVLPRTRAAIIQKLNRLYRSALERGRGRNFTQLLVVAKDLCPETTIFNEVYDDLLNKAASHAEARELFDWTGNWNRLNPVGVVLFRRRPFLAMLAYAVTFEQKWQLFLAAKEDEKDLREQVFVHLVPHLTELAHAQTVWEYYQRHDRHCAECLHAKGAYLAALREKKDFMLVFLAIQEARSDKEMRLALFRVGLQFFSDIAQLKAYRAMTKGECSSAEEEQAYWYRAAELCPKKK